MTSRGLGLPECYNRGALETLVRAHERGYGDAKGRYWFKPKEEAAKERRAKEEIERIYRR